MRLTRPLAALAFAFALSAPAAASAEPAAAQSEAAESVALGGLSLGVALDNAEYSPAWLIDRELNEIAATGARWVRFDIKWADVQRRGRRAYDWARYDALVWRASARGLRVLANLAYAPAWARPRGTSNKFAPNNARRRAAFARFAAAAGARYRGHVGAWEI